VILKQTIKLIGFCDGKHGEEDVKPPWVRSTDVYLVGWSSACRGMRHGPRVTGSNSPNPVLNCVSVC